MNEKDKIRKSDPVVEGELMPPKNAAADLRSGRNIYIQTLNIITGPLQKMYDPVRKICYEPLVKHWEERYKKKYHPKYASKLLILDLVLLLLGGALAVAGIFAYFILPAFPALKTVDLEVLAPQVVISGAPSKIVISYRNESGATMAGAALTMELPEGFVESIDSETARQRDSEMSGEENTGKGKSRVFDLGEIAPNGRGQVTVQGVFYSPLGTEQALTGELTYWAEGETEQKRVALYKEWTAEDAVIQVGLRPESEIIRGRRITVTVPYANGGEEPLDTVIRVLVPEDFVMTGAAPAAASGDEWRLGRLEPGERGAINLYGYLRAISGAAPNFVVQAYAVVDGQRRLVQEARQDLEALTTGFELEQEISQHTGRVALRPDESFTVAVRYGNGGQHDIRRLKIELETEPAGLAVPLEEGGLIWDETRLPGLAWLAPGARGQIEAGFRIDPAATLAAAAPGETPKLTITARAEYFLDDELARPVHAEAGVIDATIASSLGLKAQAMYFTADGEQLGSGPLPPRASQTTKYWVFLTVSNTTSDVRDAKLECFLAPGVAWTGRYSVTAGEALAHSPSTGQVIWEIGAVPGRTDGGGSRVAASFEVALTPAKSEIGTEPILVKDILMAGVDETTGIKLTASAPDVTTALTGDSRAAGKGTVVK